MNSTQQLILGLTRDVAPHVVDPRARALLRASLAIRQPRVAGPRRDRLAAVEAERKRLLADQTVFDGRDHGPITIAEYTRRASQNAKWCRFLHAFAGEVAAGSVVEMGTAMGISGAAIATALPEGAQMWTIDLRTETNPVAVEVFKRVGVDVTAVTGRFAEVLDDVLGKAAPVDFLYVDGHHDGQVTLDYTEQAAPYLSDRAVVVYDDIRWSLGMRGAWDTLRGQRRWAWAADLHMLGVCALG